MKRYIGSLLLAMVFALGLLPTTALAAGEDGSLYVAGQKITESGCYENQNGIWTKVDGTEPASGQFHYDINSATLTLNTVSIEGGPGVGDTLSLQTTDSEASLEIVLQGENSLTGGLPVRVCSDKNDASLNITGQGTLTATGTGQGGTGGIFVQSGPMGSENGSYLTIKNGANVISNSTKTTAVTLVAPAAGEAILTVQGGSLTADGGSSAGIYYDKLDGNIPAENQRYLRIAQNGIIRRNHLSYATGLNIQIQYGSPGGIIFDGGSGTVYGKVELQKDLTIGKGESLKLNDGASLNAGGHNVIVDGGTLDESLATSLGDSVKYAPTIITQPTGQSVTEGETATFTVEATGTEKLSYQWQQSTDKGKSWTNIDDANAATYTTAATTTSVDGTQYRCVVSNSAGKVTSDVVTLTVNKHVHTWGDPVWSWSEDGKTCTVTFICQNDETHKETPAVTVTSAVKTPATCTEKGVTTYTATVEFNGKTHTDTKDVTDIPATGHSWGEPVWSWSADGKSCTVTFTCKNNETHKESPTVKIASKVKTPATCQAKGVTTYTATAELDGKTYTSTKDVTDIPLADHVAKWEGDYPATCDTNGREGTATCTVCGKVLVEDKVIPAPGHKYGEPVWTWSKDGKSCTVTFTCSVCGYASENKATVTTKTSTEATCTQPGTATQQAQVVFNGNTYTTTKGNVTLAALGHNYKDGKCTRCGQADPNAKPAATASVTTGANGKWQTDSTQGLSFTYAGDGKFLRVQVNGTTLKEDQYQQQGNTVTLTQEYLKTLDPGSYTLVIALENSSAKTTFTVEQPAQATPVPTPQPTQQPEEQEDSEKSGNLLWIALGGGAAVLLIGGVAFLRFKRSLYD